MTRRLMHEHPRRLATILIFVGAFGFAIWPAAVLGPKYLQDTLHYSPPQAAVLTICGGLIAVIFNILMGKLSEKIGRRVVVFFACAAATVGYGIFFSGIHLAVCRAICGSLGFFGFLCADSMFAGFAAEIMPTAYRATVSGLRYLTGILAGAVSLALEGKFYDWLGGHGYAVICAMAAMPIAMAAILFLPEPAGRTLEDIAAEPDKR